MKGITKFLCLAIIMLSIQATNTIASAETTSGLTLSKSDVTVNLVDLGGSAQLPSETTTGLSYTSSNPNVAKVYGTYLRYVSPGTSVITVSDGTNSASYNLHVVTNDAGYTINDETFTVTSAGKMDVPTVHVPGMTLNIGNGSNAVVVRTQDDNSTLGTQAIDENGFTHLWQGADGNPYEGTFYKFTATMSGSLTITGFSTAAGSMVWRDITASTSEQKTLSLGNNTLSNLPVVNGHSYYLYEDLSGSSRNYNTLALTSFTFNPTFRLATTHAVTTHGATSYTYQDLLSGISGDATVSAIGKGGVAMANVSLSNGSTEGQRTLNISGITYSNGGGNGGAVVVNVSSESGSGVFVLTIPYETHEWSFTNMDYKQLEDNTTNWMLTYQVRNYEVSTDENNNTVRTLNYLNVPVMSSTTAIDGTNAYYIDQTAGLLIKANGGQWGALATLPNESSKTLVDYLNTPYTEVNGVNQITIYNGSTITIPNLKKGQYVRMKWLRHAENNGDLITATNLTDLDGKPITSTFQVGSISYNHGYEEFIVANDGDVTFTLSQDGWTNIVNITVGNSFLDTDMRLYNPNLTTISTRGTEETEIDYNGNWGYNWTTSALSTTFSIKDGSVSSTLNARITGDGKLTVSGNGYLTIVQKAYNNNYLLDTEETRITVNNEGDVSQNYPYTWDFTNISQDTKDALAADVTGTHPIWSKASDTTYGLIVSNTNFSQGSNLTANDISLREFDGLGFRTTNRGTDYDRVINLNTDGTGIEFGRYNGTYPSTIIIPSVPKGFYVYVRCHRNVGTDNNYGTITFAGGNGDAEIIHTGGGGNRSDDWIYRIAGNDANISITLRDYNIYKIGVTATLKDFNAYNGSSYITEYRDHNEKYDLTGYFTYNASPVTATIISSVNDDRTIATTKDIAVAPAETGVILKCASTTDNKSVPLFVTDVNTPTDDVSGNMLSGVLTPTAIGPTSTDANGNDCRNYIFTRVYYKVDQNGNITEGTNANTGTLGFYRIANNDASNLGANKAYLKVPLNDDGTSGAKAFYLIPSLFAVTPTGINSVRTSVYDEPTTYFTLSGQRLSGKPEQSGIYIVNGRKVIVR